MAHAQHALITGPITGRIPIKHKRNPDGHVDVTPDVVYSDDPAHIAVIAEAIEAEHRVRGTHPESETGGN